MDIFTAQNIISITAIISSALVSFYSINRNTFGTRILNDINNWKDKKRELILEYRINNFMKLALAVQRKFEKNSPYLRDLEYVTADIQLFGTKEEIEFLNKFLDELKKLNQGNLNELLNKLRENLREELELESINSGVVYFRPEGAVTDK